AIVDNRTADFLRAFGRKLLVSLPRSRRFDQYTTWNPVVIYFYERLRGAPALWRRSGCRVAGEIGYPPGERDEGVARARQSPTGAEGNHGRRSKHPVRRRVDLPVRARSEGQARRLPEPGAPLEPGRWAGPDRRRAGTRARTGRPRDDG